MFIKAIILDTIIALQQKTLAAKRGSCKKRRSGTISLRCDLIRAIQLGFCWC